MTRKQVTRPVSRVILIGPGTRVLMFRGGDPGCPENGTWWVTPGGGAEAGETPQQTARRELIEETGQADIDWRGMVARRTVTFEFMGRPYFSDESYFLAFTESLDVEPVHLTDLELVAIEEHRWLTTSELEDLEEPVYPAELSSVLPDLAERRLPAEPWLWSP